MFRPLVCRTDNFLFTLFVSLRIVVSNTYLCCIFVLFFFVLCPLCCQFLWIIHCWLLLRYSLPFIDMSALHWWWPYWILYIRWCRNNCAKTFVLYAEVWMWCWVYWAFVLFATGFWAEGNCFYSNLLKGKYFCRRKCIDVNYLSLYCNCVYSRRSNEDWLRVSKSTEIFLENRMQTQQKIWFDLNWLLVF